MFTHGGQAQAKDECQKKQRRGREDRSQSLACSTSWPFPLQQMIPARMKIYQTACWFHGDVPRPSQWLRPRRASPSLSAAVLMARWSSPAPLRPPCLHCRAGVHPDELNHQEAMHRLARGLCGCPTPTGTARPHSCPCPRAQTPATSWGGKTPQSFFPKGAIYTLYRLFYVLERCVHLLIVFHFNLTFAKSSR